MITFNEPFWHKTKNGEWVVTHFPHIWLPSISIDDALQKPINGIGRWEWE